MERRNRRPRRAVSRARRVGRGAMARRPSGRVPTARAQDREAAAAHLERHGFVVSASALSPAEGHLPFRSGQLDG